MTVTTFGAYPDHISFVELVRDRNLLAAVGVDDDQNTSALKVFNMDKLDANKCPVELAAAKVKFDLKGFPPSSTPTALACTADMSDVAIGFAQGDVVLVHYDSQLRYAQTRVLCHHENDVVTGLAFKRDESLYVVTMRGLYEYPVQLTGQNQFRLFGAALAAPPLAPETVLDEQGASFNCTSQTEDGELIVATAPAIFFWKDEDKGQCLAFDGEKVLVHWFRGNLTVVTARPAPPGDERKSVHELAIYDTRNKLVAYQDSKIGNVARVASEWGSTFVFTTGGRVYELVEKDTQSKLESLFKKNLYTVAITLAQNNQLDPAAIASIITRYAEHLYSKGDYDGSIQQFIRTIGQLEPSYVIGKFLDAQRIHNLTSYLQALHEKGLANSDHTTLLLNCYTKLKDVVKLEQFLSREQGGNFDVETAIKVCRQAGYYDHALRLSQQYHQHDWFLKIQLEDLHQYTVALHYISSLAHDDAELYLKKYGKTLVSFIPAETTDQLVTMCTTDPAQLPASSSSASSPAPSLLSADHLSGSDGAAAASAMSPSPAPPAAAVEVDANAGLVAPLPLDKDLPPVVQLDLGSLEPISTSPPPQSQSQGAGLSTSQFATAAMEKAAEYRDKAASFLNSIMPLNKSAIGGGSAEQKSGSSEGDGNNSTSITSTISGSTSIATTGESDGVQPLLQTHTTGTKRFERSKPEDFIHIYVGKPRWLCVFLEKVVGAVEGVSSINYDTLLELYLRAPEDETHPETAEQKEARLEKARQLLVESGPLHYDPHHALVLCQRYEYHAGVMILLEKLNMYYEIIQTHMERHEYAQVLQDCHKFGQLDPNLWVQVLTYFASLDEKCDQEISDVLDNIDKRGLLSPLLVLQILAQKPSMPLLAVKEYIASCLQAERKVLADNQREIAAYREETAKLRAEIHDLATTPKVFQISKCSYCGQPLTPPAVHFLCMHSFHQHCLSETERECPLCAPANRQTLETKRSLEEKANQHSQFMKQLEAAKDGFSTIAEYCGRSIFGCLNDDPAAAAAAASAADPAAGTYPSTGTLPVAVPLDF